MAYITITIGAATLAALDDLLRDHRIRWVEGGVLHEDPALRGYYRVDRPPEANDRYFGCLAYDDSTAGQSRVAELQAALGDNYWSGPPIASWLGLPGYASPTGNDLIKHERDKRIENGGYKVGNNWFHSDKTSRDQHMMLYVRAKEVQAAGGNMDSPFPNPAMPGSPLLWKTLGGPYVPMTPNLALQIVTAAQVQQAALHLVAAQAMQACTAPSAVQWPETFSG